MTSYITQNNCQNGITISKRICALKIRKRQRSLQQSNFRPISCLPLMWKPMTGVVSKSLYEIREESSLLPGKQKGCRKGSRRTKHKLLTDKTILRDHKERHVNLASAGLIRETPVIWCRIVG